MNRYIIQFNKNYKQNKRRFKFSTELNVFLGKFLVPKFWYKLSYGLDIINIESFYDLTLAKELICSFIKSKGFKVINITEIKGNCLTTQSGIIDN